MLVPGGTTVVVALTEPISSATATANDQVAIVVKKPVAVDGWVVIPAGSNGHATVTQVTHASGNGSGGKISMTVDWVYSSDGGMLQLSTSESRQRKRRRKGCCEYGDVALLGTSRPGRVFCA